MAYLKKKEKKEKKEKGKKGKKRKIQIFKKGKKLNRK
jgi:hypothetical protein